MIDLALALLAGILILDVVLELYGSHEARARRRQRDRDRVAIARTIDRTGGPRP